MFNVKFIIKSEEKIKNPIHKQENLQMMWWVRRKLKS
jgi:hypothetical protein